MGRKGFGFSPQKVSSIDEQRTPEMKKIALLDAWAERNGRDATNLKLVQDLCSGGRRDLADHLLKKIEDASKAGTLFFVYARIVK